jgi:hypothetical protein
MRADTSRRARAWLLSTTSLLAVLGATLPGAVSAQTACATDDGCAADQYCAPTGACTPRCDAAGLCVGPPVARNLGLASDGAHVCFVGPPSDTSAESTIWSWDASAAPPRLLGSAAGVTALLVADGFCYIAASSLSRAPLVGGTQETLAAAAPRRVWLGPEHVWWTLPVAQGLEVWRTLRASVAPEQFALASANQNWEAATSTHLFRRAQGSRACDIVSAPLSDLAAESVTRMSYSWSCGGELQADEQGLFFNQYSGSSYQLHRLDFASQAQIDAGLTSTDYGPVRYLPRGGWIFAARVENPAPGNVYPVTFYRRPRALDAPKEQLYVAASGTPNTRAMQFAVLGNAIVHVTREERLVAQRIAPPPCSATLACPDGTSCGADQLCAEPPPTECPAAPRPARRFPRARRR